MERPWAEPEQLSLLCEIIRESGKVTTGAVLDFISSQKIEPQWGNMILPPGRSMNQCSGEYDRLRRDRQNGVNPRKRPHEFTQIQPRPTNGDSSVLAVNSPIYGAQAAGAGAGVSGPGDAPPRKRGRPTKEETERRRAEALARGEPYPPVKKRDDASSNASAGGGEVKRKRGRPTKEEAAAKLAKAAAMDAQARSQQIQQSQHGLLGAHGVPLASRELSVPTIVPSSEPSQR